MYLRLRVLRVWHDMQTQVEGRLKLEKALRNAGAAVLAIRVCIFPQWHHIATCDKLSHELELLVQSHMWPCRR